jgi:hypothetical protein
VHAHVCSLLCQSFSCPWILLQKSMSRMFTLDGREMSSRYQKTNTWTNYSACRLEVILLQTSLIAKVHIDQTSFHLNVPEHLLLLCKFLVSEMWLSRTSWLNLDWWNSVPCNTFISDFARKSHTIEEAILQDVNDKFLQGFTSPARHQGVRLAIQFICASLVMRDILSLIRQSVYGRKNERTSWYLDEHHTSWSFFWNFSSD